MGRSARTASRNPFRNCEEAVQKADVRRSQHGMGCAESTPLAELQSGGLTKEQSIDGELTAGPVAVTCVRGFRALGGTNTVTGVGMGMPNADGPPSARASSRVTLPFRT